MVGYKQFFNDYLGLRYYANLDIFHNLEKFNGERLDITLLNYGVNVDFLGNFVVTNIADFGGFIGLGIGANTLMGEYIDTRKGYPNFKNTSFDVALNAGLRANIAHNHGLEVAVRAPFLPNKMIDYTYNDSIKLKETFGQTFSILARYSFSF